MATGAVSSAALAACNREPIHVPGAIQPHGALLVLEEPNLECLQASRNAADFFGASLDAVLPELRPLLSSALSEGDPAVQSPMTARIGGCVFDLSLHRNEAGLIVECEVAVVDQPALRHRALQRAIAELRSAADLAAMHGAVARFVAELTGFERVMVYRFDADWHGEVVGEHLLAPVDSYLGHHFPASDIPEQARALYRKSWLRIIPDATYEPVAIEPATNPRTGRSLDLSFAVLRSVSPVHLEYLRNMDVAASMSISLIVDGELWGLIACHDRAPRSLPAAVRAAAELFGQIVSLEIGARQEARRLAEHVEATTIQTRFFDVISRESNVIAALLKYTPELLEFMGATGAAIHVSGRTTLLGRTPTEAEVSALVAWLDGQTLHPLLATHALSTVFPAAAAYAEVASGLLAVKLSRVESHYVLWFRPEVVTTVTWAGRPEKDVDENQRLHPRKSFSAWRQKVTGQSMPWRETERQGARELVLAINALVLRRTERLLDLNAELERKNSDLNSFAYIAAHDLTEPLRGIANTCSFIVEDHSVELSPEARRKVDTIAALCRQCGELIDALNHYSRIGRMEIAPKPVDLDRLLDEVLLALRTRIEDEGVTVIRSSPLPTVSCDGVLMREVFGNLISNAIRYNEQTEKRVEIGVSEEEEGSVFFVRDNGIGIHERHLEAVFRIFRRLHPHDAYGGGTGAGLAIVKSIVERHGGQIWLESRFGEGTTVRFTLS